MASTVTDGTTTVTPTAVKGYQAAQAGRNIFHDIIGAVSQDVTLLPPKLRNGTLNLYFEDWSDADACRTLHNRAVVFVFQDDDVDAAAMSYVLDSAGITVSLDEDSLFWIVAVAFQEVQA